MNKCIFSFLIILWFSSLCFAEPWSALFSREEVRWPVEELSLSKNIKSQIIDLLKKRYPSYIFYIENIHIVEFSGDSLPDVIYNGHTGGESDDIMLIVNNGGSFEEVFSGCGKLISLVQTLKGEPLKFRFFENACCAEDSHFIEDLVPSKANEKLKFKISNRILIDRNTKMPEIYNTDSKHFTVKKKQCEIRNEPTIDDHIWKSEDGNKIKGNVRAIYPAGSYGKIVSEYKDRNGINWCFVIIDKANKPEWEFSGHVGCNSSERADLAGWIKSEHLKLD